MKKIFILLLFIPSISFGGDMFDNVLDGIFKINPPKKYWSGVDRDEMVIKKMFLDEVFSSMVTNTNGQYSTNLFLSQGGFHLTPSNYTVTALYTFIPTKLNVVRYAVATNCETMLKMHAVVGSSTNVIGEYVLNKNVYIYNFDMPIVSTYPSNSQQILFSVTNIENDDYYGRYHISLEGVELKY